MPYVSSIPNFFCMNNISQFFGQFAKINSLSNASLIFRLVCLIDFLLIDELGINNFCYCNVLGVPP